MDAKRQRGLRPETLKELNRYLHEFAGYCQHKLDRLEDMTPDFLRDYVMTRAKTGGMFFQVGYNLFFVFMLGIQCAGRAVYR